MSASISSVYFYVGVLILHIVSAQCKFLVTRCLSDLEDLQLTNEIAGFKCDIPKQFIYPLTSQSENGSSATGHCTNTTKLSDRYQCDVPASSVVFDGYIPTLTGLDGNMWASQLLTIDASSVVLVFDFTGTPNFQVRRVEMVVFNCPQWGISLQSVRLTNSDLTQLGVVSPTLSSCDSLVRACIPDLNITSSQLSVLRLELTTLEWIHIAEVGFYGNNGTCPPEIFIPKPTTTTTEPIPATASTITTSTAAASTSDGMDQVVEENSVAVAAGVTAGVLFFIIVAIVVIIIATAIICLKTKRRKFCLQSKTFRSDAVKTMDIADLDNKTDLNGTADGEGNMMYDVLLHNTSECVQSPVYQEGTYDQVGRPERSKPHAHVDEAHEAYSQLEHSDRLGEMKLSSVSKASVSDQTQMYAVVNKPKQHKPPSQPPQPPAQEYAVVNKRTKKSKPHSHTAQPPEQEYAVVNKHRPRE